MTNTTNNNIYDLAILATNGALKIKAVRNGSKVDVTRLTLFKAVTAEYFRIKEMSDPEKAYDVAVKMACTMPDPDLADIMQCACIGAVIDGATGAYKEIHAYLDNNRRPTEITEQEFNAFFARQVRAIAASTAIDPELCAFIARISSTLDDNKRDILDLLSRGLSQRETAKELGLSVSTVQWHISKGKNSIYNTILREIPDDLYHKYFD